VRNTNTGKTFTALRDAVDVASVGDRLTVRGVCHGGTVIDKDLTIEGIGTQASGTATLDGDGKTRVLLVAKGVRIRLQGLVIRDGLADVPRWKWRRRGRGRGPLCADGLTCGRMGGGIHSAGTLVLRDVVVQQNRAGYAGALMLEGRSRVIDNRAGMDGGGINNAGVLSLGGRTRIRGNSAIGGGGVHNNGTLTLNDRSAITGNRARLLGVGYGGGVYGGHDARSIIRLNDDSHISGNWSGSRGGGVNIDPENRGTLTLNDRSHISDNTAFGPGGGVASYGTVTLNGSSHISGNITHDEGGGVEGGVVTLTADSHISGNTAFGPGGGVHSSEVTLNGSSSIRDNTAHGLGGGVRVFYAIVTLNDHSSISGNSVVSDVLYAGSGGGVASLGDVFLHDSSSISANGAETRGGGLYTEGSVTLSDASSIHDNRAGHGGGVWMIPAYGYHPSLTMTGSSRITGNRADEKGGGLVYGSSGAVLSGVYCAPQTYANVYDNTPDDCYFESP
jgi:predicted outer membrane repeat protein